MGSTITCCKENTYCRDTTMAVPLTTGVIAKGDEEYYISEIKEEDVEKEEEQEEKAEEKETIDLEKTESVMKRIQQLTPSGTLQSQLTGNKSCMAFKMNVKEKLEQENASKKTVRRITSKQLLHKFTDTANHENEIEPIVEDILTREQEEFIREILNEIQIISGFDPDTIQELILAFFKIKVQENQELYKIGEEANIFYIIDSGTVELISSQGNILLHAGDNFGLESIEESKFRSEAAKTLEPSTFLCLSGELYRNAIEYLNLKVLTEKINQLKLIPMIKNLDQIKIINLSQVIQEKKYANNSIIIYEGDNLDRIYIVKEGNIKMSKNYKKIKKLCCGEFFGDITLLVKKKSFFTYSVDSPTATIYELPYKSVKEVLSENYVRILIYRMFILAINKSDRINEYLYDDVGELYNIFQLKYYTTDEVIYCSNALKNKKISIIISGRMKKQNKNDIIAKTEDIFGEQIIDSKENLDANLVSEDITLTLEADWVNILKSFKSNSSKNVNLYETVSKMRKIPLFSTLSEIKLFQLAKKMRNDTYGINEEVIREGSLGDKFYIIKSGKVKVFQKGKFVRDMETGSCFGEISLLTGMIRTATVISSEKSECYVLDKDSFNDVVDLALLKQLQKILALQDISVNLKDLYYVKTLGSGRFGKVFLVHNQKNFYALKYAELKSICAKENLIKYYLIEKDIMLMTDHPFILKLVKTMKNRDFIFFLLEYIDGIPLKGYLEKRNKNTFKNTYETAFYGATLLCVINYLHKKRILHRDVKPDNLMIDKNGYLRLIDFGIAKILKDRDYTNTCCGTPHYLAPEVLLGKGYSYSADYWSIGVCMYEVFYGYLPFGMGSKEISDIYKDIIHKSVVLPYDPRFNDINNFFKIILSKNLIQRVCNFNLLRSHPFFHQFDFDLLTDFGIKPPFVPDSFIEQNLQGGISILTHTNMPLLNYLENNTRYDHDDFIYNPNFERESEWVNDF